MVKAGQLLVLKRDYIYIKPWNGMEETAIFPGWNHHLQASFEALDDDSEILRCGDVVLFIQSIDSVETNGHKVKHIFLWREKIWVTLDWVLKEEESELWKVKAK